MRHRPRRRRVESRARSRGAGSRRGQARPDSGLRQVRRGVRGLPRRRRQLGCSGQSEAGATAPRIPGQAIAGIQERPASKPDHAGLRVTAERRGHEEHCLLGWFAEGQAGVRQGQGPRHARRTDLPWRRGRSPDRRLRRLPQPERRRCAVASIPVSRASNRNTCSPSWWPFATAPGPTARRWRRSRPSSTTARCGPLPITSPGCAERPARLN